MPVCKKSFRLALRQPSFCRLVLAVKVRSLGLALHLDSSVPDGMLPAVREQGWVQSTSGFRPRCLPSFICTQMCHSVLTNMAIMVNMNTRNEIVNRCYHCKCSSDNQ